MAEAVATAQLTVDGTIHLVNTPVQLFTVPNARGMSACKIRVNNRPSNSAPANIKIEVRLGGTSSTPADYDTEIAVYPNNPFTWGPKELAQSNQLWVTSDTINVNFNLSGFNL